MQHCGLAHSGSRSTNFCTFPVDVLASGPSRPWQVRETAEEIGSPFLHCISQRDHLAVREQPVLAPGALRMRAPVAPLPRPSVFELTFRTATASLVRRCLIHRNSQGLPARLRRSSARTGLTLDPKLHNNETLEPQGTGAVRDRDRA